MIWYFLLSKITPGFFFEGGVLCKKMSNKATMQTRTTRRQGGGEGIRAGEPGGRGYLSVWRMSSCLCTEVGYSFEKTASFWGQRIASKNRATSTV